MISALQRSRSRPLSDCEWNLDAWDDEAQWDDWEVPTMLDHPALGPLLEMRHPYRWFDLGTYRPRLFETLAAHAGMSEEEYMRRRANALNEILDVGRQ